MNVLISGLRDAPAKPVLTVGACSWTTLFQVDAWPLGSAKILPSAALQLGDGMSASAACAVRALGADAAWWGRVGKDANGMAALQSLQAAGVDCSQVLLVEGVAGSFCTVLIDASGERLVVPRHDPTMPPEAHWLPLDRLGDYGLVLTEVRWHAGALAVLKAARQQGLPGLLDAEASGPGQLKALCEQASHVLFSETGLAQWLDRSPTYFGELLTQEDQQVAGAVRAGLSAVLQSTPATLVGVTLGAAGFYWMQQDAPGELFYQSAPKVAAVDTLAAGDVFHGAYAWAMVKGLDPAGCAAVATAAASWKCTRFGGRLGTPSFDQLRQFLATLDANHPSQA